MATINQSPIVADPNMLFNNGVFSAFPLGGGDSQTLGNALGAGSFNHRPSEEDGKLDIDVNSPLSDEENDEDEDDFKNIKFIIGKNKKQDLHHKHPRKDNSISQTQSQDEIEEFLQNNNLSQLKQFVESLGLNNLQ
jgi:hypothetical protein